ncbi:MAG: Stf0 family sulfotransferase [Xenococcaceae cyanobacterium MO_207.B15]|nr:Stf0 family sulfotransferase [Xenococcaceae cyanobacterium MO_207.B15]
MEKNNDQNFISKLQKLKNCQGIIIASVENESTIFNEVNQLVANTDLAFPVLKLFDDIFVNFMAKNHLLQSSQCNFRKPTVSYGILTLPRSGSTFLCHLLTATESAGYPTEHLRKPTFTLAKYCDFDYIRLFHHLMTYRVSLNGVFGTKIISHFLQDFEILESGLTNIFTAIDKYIYLVRKDEVAQGVSILLAEKTEIWHIDNDNKLLDYHNQLASITIDDELLEEVNHKLFFIRQQQEYIDKVLKTYQISPLVIEYEQLVENVEDNLQTILDYLGINILPETLTNLEYTIKKMGSELSRNIAEEYRKKYAIKC